MEEMYKVTEITITICFLFYTASSLTHWCPEQNLCQCKYHGQEIDLHCIGTEDLLELKQCLLENFSNFTLRTIYVEECNATSLPPRIIQNLTVEILYLKCPLLNFSVDAFVESYDSFRQFHLYNHKLTVIPDAFTPTPQLQRLWISNGSLESVGEQMESLFNLTLLCLKKNRIEYLSPSAFSSLISLRKIDLSSNLIKYIEPDAFAACESIESIILTDNYLQSAKGLFDFMDPELIRLDSNNLTDIHIFNRTMWSLVAFYLNNNPVGRIDNSEFRKYFWKLANLDLSNMSLTEIGEHVFHSLSSLTKLDLSMNEIESIHKRTFNNLRYLETLDLSQNKLSSIKGIFRKHKYMRSLSISLNRIVELEDSLHGAPNLEILHVDRNEVQALTDEIFRHSTHIKVFSAKHNNISIITKDCFKYLKDIVQIDLAFNSLLSLNGSIQNLISLNKLYLLYNRIERLEDDDLANIPLLFSVNFLGNRLSSLNGQFKYLYNLEYLNLCENRILRLSKNTFPKVIPIRALYMEGNPLVCDCRLEWLSEWSKKYKHSPLKDNPLCQAPFWLKGKYFKNVSISDLVDWKSSCSSSCQCSCIPNGLELGIKVDCANRNLTVMPEVFPSRMIRLDISHNNLVTFERTNLNSSLLDHLQELNIENNQIVSMQDLRFLKDLSVLKVANNNLETLDVDEKANYSLISLSGNPWLCDCSTVWFRDWLFTLKDEIIDINQTKCAKGNVKNEMRHIPIIYLSDSQICPTKIVLYISISIGILGFLLIISTSAVAYFRYRLNIKIWLYSHGFTWVKEDDIDKDKEFDAFVSYSSHDEKFVDKILRPTLENGSPAFLLYIRERNFLVEKDISSSIIAAVKCSRRTILVLSRNFFENEWSALEFRTAHLQALKDKINRVIVIIYGEMPPDEDIDEELKVYLKSTAYIKWGEKYFWQKLHYALPKVNRERERVPLHYDENVPLLIGY